MNPTQTGQKTLLIANRGEIARRVIRTARRLGWRTVAIHSDLDATAPHVRDADQAVRVPGYLDIEAIVAVARATGADAVHPGYGFLSERAEFARALEAADIALVGPSAEVMDRMGRKDHAREIAIAAGVPVVPSYDVAGDPAGFDYPVLVKAAAGGGGKGMRVVDSADGLAEALAAAGREAASSFGDDTLLIEKYVESGRHVEVQVLADKHGTVVHCFERDCSPQRRHQKVLEEAPAPTIGEETRRVVLESAVALAAQVGYVNAGTVEFLVDNDPRAGGAAYFLEMNTRLQVEHPVTEAITGLDLVELQLLIAEGRPLPISQADIAVGGHAIEARVYAEDPFVDFLPQAGTATSVRWPERARVDAALESGQVVSTAYDPMLGKIIVHGVDREAARRALVAALDDTAILGFTTNVGFLRALAASDEFGEASIDTAWLDKHQVLPPNPGEARTLAARQLVRELAGSTTGPFGSDGFRLGAEPAAYQVRLDETVRLSHHDLADGEIGDDQLTALEHRGAGVEVVHQGQRFVFVPSDRMAPDAVLGDGSLVAEMPGTLLSVTVAEGESVVEGQTLGVVEAMKMELALKSPFDGVVVRVGGSAGDQVSMGAVLFEVSRDD